MGKVVSWNHVVFKLPDNWEVTSEGGSRFNGIIVAAPEKGGKLEIYWRRSSGKKYWREHERYVDKLVKRGFERRSRFKVSIKGHEAFEDVLINGNVKVFVTTWYCDETNRLFIVQMDGEKVSQSIFSEVLNSINCHPGDKGVVDWRLMGIGLRLYTDYFLLDRIFKIGYSMAYFMSRDKKVHVIQYSIPKYVHSSISFRAEDTWKRHAKMLIPKFTVLDLISRNNYSTYIIRHRFIKSIKYGYLLSKIDECKKPNYIQYTLVKTDSKRLEEACSIIGNTLCVEW
ncbi:MAG: hypothetical protein B6U89_03085 [Desulfurococcales archaeon ex4484_58]|nr:MAG: hypothetical protein B6U89_03085 [Desulfurococcales archaeon ex4484_58]